MRQVRLGVLLLWAGFAGLPLFILARVLVAAPAAWDVWSEASRLVSLLRNTAVLLAGTLAVVIPVGCLAAAILYRSDLPGRFALRRLVVLSMFIPLPLFASAWQSLISLLGMGTLYLQPTWGLVTAVIIHSAASLPWMIWLIGQGFLWVERHIEEDALMYGGAWTAFRHVTMRRALPTIGMAAVWVGIQTASEITITDMCQVRTFAEEVYTQFVRPDPATDGGADGLARSLAVAVPPAVLAGIVVAALAWNWRRRFPPLGVAPPSEWPLFHLGSRRWLAASLIVLLLIGAAGVPIASLVWKAGRVPPNHWSALVVAQQLERAWQAQSTRMFTSLLWATVTGGGLAMLAVIMCWSLLPSRYLWRFIALSVVILWSLPGPVIGIGLKETINSLMRFEDMASRHHTELFSTALYNGRTPLPVMWATGLRFVACAFALFWPVVRIIPQELRESVRIDSGSPRMELRCVIFPLTANTLARATLIGAALCLGELSASKLVETPAGQTFAHEIFTQMHTGISNHLAAMCLILLAFVALIGALIAIIPVGPRAR